MPINKPKNWSVVILLGICFLMIFLRFYKLKFSPPSPYWEEVALAYDAYSISQTARDHHGHFLPLAAFESFGDYKPSLYFYVLVPFIRVFGLNLFATRLPTILASLAIIFGIATLAKILFADFYCKSKPKAVQPIFLLALFLSTISPWLLTFSRSAWESTLASALIVWGVNFYLFFNKTNKTKWAVLAVGFLVLSTYAYHAARLTAPLLGVALVIVYLTNRQHLGQKIAKNFNIRALIISTLLALVMFWPILCSLQGQSGQQRITETSIFTDIAIIEDSNEAIYSHGSSLWAKLIYHRYWFFAREITRHFFDHFSFRYLFISGDSNPRHSVQTFGEFYYLDLFFFISAVVFLLRYRNKISYFLFFYLLVAILPAALTKATPHALRTLAALPVFIIFLTFGLWQFLEFFKNKRVKTAALIASLIFYSLLSARFFYQLVYIYPENYKSEWQYGYQEMDEKLALIKDRYDKIYITREKGRPAMYYFFYQQIDPSLVQAANAWVKKDQGEFLEFDNITFIDKSDQVETKGKILVVSSLDFYQKFFEQQNFHLIDATADQTWVFYEQN